MSQKGLTIGGVTVYFFKIVLILGGLKVLFVSKLHAHMQIFHRLSIRPIEAPCRSYTKNETMDFIQRGHRGQSTIPIDIFENSLRFSKQYWS